MSINIPKKRVESLEGSLDSKQNKLVAGQNIIIDESDPQNPVISSIGGGEGGSSNYDELENKPRLNSVILEGNKTAKDLSIFDSTTLIAGKNVTIDEVLSEGGIDQRTIACWHFDGRLEDEVSAFVPGNFSTDFLITSSSKYGSGCCDIKYASTLATFNEFDSFTVDFWYKHNSEYQAAYVGINSDSGSSTTAPTNGYRLVITGTQIGFQHSRYFENNSDSEYVDFPMYSSKTWHHIAVQRIGASILQLFVDGVMLLQKTMDLSLERNNNVVFYGPGEYFDEIRVSHTVRYNENFTPPTQPYSKSESTGKWKINSSSEPLAPATTNSLGGIKVGTGLSITEDGTLNNDGYSSNDFTTPLKVKLQGIEENANNFSTSFNPETNTLIFSKGVK